MTDPEIVSDIGTLLEDLSRLGVVEVGSNYDSKHFGNYLVDLRGPNGSFRITRDKSQYMIFGDDERLKAMGLLRAFETRDQLRTAALQYAQTVV